MGQGEVGALGQGFDPEVPKRPTRPRGSSGHIWQRNVSTNGFCAEARGAFSSGQEVVWVELEVLSGNASE